MILALSHAFTGPLLSVLDRDGGGFHLRGASSSGKTKILRAATSVWGGPSFMQSWRSTDNGLEGVAAACSHSLLVLDELHQVDPKVAGEVTYMLANGRGKSRSSAGGRNQVTQCWTVPVLSSGEISLEAHMASGGRSIKEGQEVRLIDLSAECRRHRAFDTLHEVDSGDAFAKRIQHAIETDYGVAGPAFVEKLMTRIDQVGSIAEKTQRVLKNSKRVAERCQDGQVRRVLDRFALAALAGEMATKFGLTGWNKGEALHEANDLFIVWLEARDQDTQAEVEAALERTRSYVRANAENFIQLGRHDGNEADGWRDAEWIYVRPACWRRIHGADGHDEAARLHRSAGTLRSQQGEGLQFRMGREVVGRPRVCAVRASAVLAA
jgi:putative DNA primase/helicase